MEWHMAARVLAFLMLIIFINIPPTSSSCDRAILRKELRRRSDAGESSFTESLKSAVVRSRTRSQKIDAIVNKARSKSSDPETPIHLGDGEYIMEMAVGTPAVTFEAIADTGSDLVWTQCLPCKNCYKQSTPIFDPSKSSTYSTVPCNDSLCRALEFGQAGCNPNCSFMYRYSDGSSTSGELSYETLTIGSGAGKRPRTYQAVPSVSGKIADTGFGCGHDNQGRTVPSVSSKTADIGFGCGHDNQGQTLVQAAGVVGLGRGPLSLISQIGAQVDNKFSYCLLPISDPPSKTSPLFFGNSASFSGAKSVTLIKSALIPTFWYIPLTGITLNGSAIDIVPGTFDLKADGSGGIVIDSGTTVTILNEDAYSPLKKAVQSAVDLPPADGSSTGLDLCYNIPSLPGEVKLPSFAFNFQGGVDYEVPPENFFVEIDDLLCLAFLGSSGGISILGNLQQQNVHILYDNGLNTLSFKPTDCNSL